MPSIAESAAKIIDDFRYLDDWEERYAYLIDLGENLPVMRDDLKNEENRIHGCVSQVWLSADCHQGKILFSGTSDSSIVRGLIALLFTLYQTRTPDEIYHHRPNDFFDALGLAQHLSPSRSNGFHAMIGKIREIAANHL